MLAAVFAFILSFSLAPIPRQEVAIPLDSIPLVSPVDSLHDQKVFIDKIFIVGNKKTKEKIILRELDVEVNDVLLYSELEKVIKLDKNKILNTGLFVSVKISILELSPTIVDLVIQVKERWYTFPLPIFKLADRNFNEWWTNQGRDLSRVDYGLRFYQYNVRGMNERLRLTAQFGFTKIFDLQYTAPSLDKAQKNGLTVFGTFTENKNLAYKSSGHKLVFLDADFTLRETFSTGLVYSHRGSFYNTNYITLSFNHKEINDTVATLNPDYFLDGKTRQDYFLLSYEFRRDLRDIRAYPLKGFLLFAEANKLGLGIFNDINQFEVKASYSRYLPLKNNYYVSSSLSGQMSFPRAQPYLHFKGFGYQQQNVRGYELYVIEGHNYLLHKTTFKKQLYKGAQSLGNTFPLEQFRSIPIAIYLKSYFDAGIVDNNIYYPENTRLTNRLIYGGGLGLDFVTYYDLVLRLEYSLNSIGESGLFINLQAEF